ncbi:MAG: 2Fe-2S iron-sulfur cluster-binding protein, partial [Kiritimatiellae bacterium]|nr:2Fe-2S iron-sulfur cluster-binding protein [Kiritimatiellia bacterium]
MAKSTVKVLLQPFGRVVLVTPGTAVLEAVTRAGLSLETPCGGVGRCGKCLVRLASGTLGGYEKSAAVLAPEQIQRGYRLACQSHVTSDVVLEIVQAHTSPSRHKILEEVFTSDIKLCPAISKRVLTIPVPSLDDQRPDLERLKTALGRVKVEVSVLQHLPTVLRKANFKVTV